MMKRVLAMLLVMAMAFSMAACNTAPSSPASSGASVTGSSTDTQDANGDYPVLRINMHNIFGSRWASTDIVQDALNKVLREKAQAEVEIVCINVADLKQQTNLLMTGGDDSLDILLSFSYSTVGELHANGQVIALDDLMATDGQGIQELYAPYSEILDCGRIDGKLYGIPAFTAWSSPNSYYMMEECANAAGVEFPEKVTLDELTDLLVTVKEANPDKYFLGGNNAIPWHFKDIDYLGDTNYLGVITDPVNSTTVENLYESDYFMNLLDNVKIWKEKELIHPDSYTLNNPRSPISDRTVWGVTGYSYNRDEYLYEVNTAQSYGGNMVGSEVGDRIITSGNVATYLWHITSFCEDPEAAMRVLNVLYTDPEAANIFMNGVEGVTYVVDENGQLTWPEGKSSQQDVGWMAGYNYSHPNGFLTPTWNTMRADAYDLMRADNASAERSLALGFTCNMEPVADQYAACANVVAEYLIPMLLGVVDIDETLPVFQQELHDAGIDDIIAEKQAQLDRWLASK